MSTNDIRFETAKALDALAEELDVSPAKYQDAEERYKAVCEWLGAEGSELAEYEPDLYPQGSFALGTAIRPLGDDHYDVDVVCLLDEIAANISQKELKRKVGDRLKENERYRKMLKPPEGGRRCWTLEYADASKFHLDILPAIPDPLWLSVGGHVPEEWAKHAIQITDTTTWDRLRDWPRSNPRGFAAWFKYQMRVRLEEGRRVVAKAKAASIAEIPDYEVRTPLQRLVQILKRHRDMRYAGNEHRPISVIITTLAAHAYDNEASLADAIETVVPRMRTFIQQRDGIYWVPNPVNPAENFADKWAAEPEKAETFFEWLEAVERDYRTLLTPTGFRDRDRHLAEMFGTRDAAAAMKRATGRTAPAATLGGRVPVPPRAVAVSRFDVPHRETPKWPMAPQVLPVSITADFKRNGSKARFTSNGTPLPKHSSLMFHADVPVSAPYDVFWQVVNTGREATDAGSLRGQILPSQSAGVGGRHQREESTLYTGSHWVECFVVKNGVCVARSGEFVVNIE